MHVSVYVKENDMQKLEKDAAPLKIDNTSLSVCLFTYKFASNRLSVRVQFYLLNYSSTLILICIYFQTT